MGAFAPRFIGAAITSCVLSSSGVGRAANLHFHHVSLRSRSTRSRSRSESPRCQKMFVPGFGEASPEAKAANNLHNFFTYMAVKIVLAQLESYNPEAYKDLMEFTNRNSLNDGDKFCAALLRESPNHKGLALRILEVRSAYCKMDFEWDNLKRLALKQADEANRRLMREYIQETSFSSEGSRET